MAMGSFLFKGRSCRGSIMFGGYEGEVASRTYYTDFSSAPVHFSMSTYNQAKNNNNNNKTCS